MFNEIRRPHSEKNENWRGGVLSQPIWSKKQTKQIDLDIHDNK